MNTSTVREEADEIISLKNGKAIGIEAIQMDMLKVDFQHLLESFHPFSTKFGNAKKYQKIGGRVSE